MTDVKDMTVCEALQHLEAKIDKIIEKLDAAENKEKPQPAKEFVYPGGDCQV